MEEKIERIEATATIPVTLEIEGEKITAVISERVLIQSQVTMKLL